MNKYQEALNSIRKCIVSKHGKLCIEMVQELVDKETPLKPKGLACPKCSKWVVEDTYKGTLRFNRCHDCGQRVDWSSC